MAIVVLLNPGHSMMLRFYDVPAVIADAVTVTQAYCFQWSCLHSFGRADLALRRCCWTRGKYNSPICFDSALIKKKKKNLHKSQQAPFYTNILKRAINFIQFYSTESVTFNSIVFLRAETCEKFTQTIVQKIICAPFMHALECKAGEDLIDHCCFKTFRHQKRA